MYRRVFIILGVVLAVLVITYVGFTIAYRQILPSQEAILQAGSIKNSQLAGLAAFSLNSAIREAEKIQNTMKTILIIEGVFIASFLIVWWPRGKHAQVEQAKSVLTEGKPEEPEG